MIKKTEITKIFYQTVHHFLPEFSNWLKVVSDPGVKGVVLIKFRRFYGLAFWYLF